MKRKFFTVLFAAAIGVATIPAYAQVSGDVVKIGVLTDMTGVYADLGGQGSIVAAQMAIDDFGGKVLGDRDKPPPRTAVGDRECPRRHSPGLEL